MANRLSKLEYLYKIYTAKLAGGDYYWNIYAPTYSQVDNTWGAATFIGRKFHAEPTDARLSNDEFRDLELFVVCGDSQTFSAGNILQETTSTDFPVMTVLQNPEMHEVLAMKTSKTGKITDGADDIFINLSFEFTIAFNAGKDEYSHIPTSFNLPIRKAVLYKRSGVTEGMTFWDLTPGQGVQDNWRITLVDYRENIMILHLDRPDRT